MSLNTKVAQTWAKDRIKAEIDKRQGEMLETIRKIEIFWNLSSDERRECWEQLERDEDKFYELGDECDFLMSLL
jgi:hypothetical protein